MRCFIVTTLLSCAVFTSAVAQTDCLRLTETNLIAFCADNCEIAAHVKVASRAFVLKPIETNTLELTVLGRLMTLEVKSVYFRGEIGTHFPTNVYLYRDGMVAGAYHDPALEVGREYLVFLKEDKVPDIVRDGTVTDPPLPATNYFSHVHLPKKQWLQMLTRKPYMVVPDAGVLSTLEKHLSETAGMNIRRVMESQKMDSDEKPAACGTP
jgi:hypothetical protein